jgi:hypothetical protein
VAEVIYGLSFLNKTVKGQSMEPASKVPWKIAEEGTRVANNALNTAYGVIPPMIMICCVTPLKYSYAYLPIIFFTFFVGREMKLLRRYEGALWRKIFVIALIAISLASILKGFVLYFGPIFESDEINLFLPSLFSVLVFIVSPEHISNRTELSYYKSKGYNYIGYLGDSDQSNL